jgi:hypothetical protein
MVKIDKVDKEMAAYETRPLEDVKLQEALIIIAVYAAQLDYQNCEADVKRIEAILERHELFVAGKKAIFSMINKFVNEMEVSGSQKALEIAADTLTPEQRDIGFELAVEVALPNGDLTAEKKKMFDVLRAQLSIDRNFAQAAIRDKAEKSKQK